MQKNTNLTPKPIDHAYAQQAIQTFLKRYDPEDVNRNLRILLLLALGNAELLDREEYFDIMRDIKGLFDLMDDMTLWHVDESL